MLALADGRLPLGVKRRFDADCVTLGCGAAAPGILAIRKRAAAVVHDRFKVVESEHVAAAISGEIVALTTLDVARGDFDVGIAIGSGLLVQVSERMHDLVHDHGARVPIVDLDASIRHQQR